MFTAHERNYPVTKARVSILQTNQQILECLEDSLDIASMYCNYDEKEKVEKAVKWVKKLREELDEPILKKCRLADITKCSKEYHDVCDEKYELEQKLERANNKLNTILTIMTVNKIQALA